VTWSPGETVLLQETWRDRVWAARPMKVARDEGDFVALWFPKGTRWKAPTTPAGRLRAETRGERLATCLAQDEWAFVDASWDVDTLCLLRAGDWHAVWVSWLAPGEQWGWYVNLQEPFRRTTCGFATMDLALDVIIDVDGSWRWKDVDELESYVTHGVVDPGLAERLRVEGLSVVDRHRNGEWPFSDGWAAWTPDPSWSLPELPEGWDRLCRAR